MRHARRLLRLLGGLTLGTVALVAFTPLTGAWLRRASPPARIERADAIVVLGSGADPEGNLEAGSLRRLVEGVRLCRLGFAPLLVLAGPAVRPGGLSEAASRARLAGELGVPAAAMVLVDDARTTREEARTVGVRLRPRGVRAVLLVTSRPHMSRAAALFSREGFVVHPAPVDDVPPGETAPEDRLSLARALLQELVGRAYYRLFGYI